MRAKGFSCSLDVLYGGLGISKLQFFDQKKINFFSYVFFKKKNFGHQTLDPDLVSLELLDPDSLNPDPQQ